MISRNAFLDALASSQRSPELADVDDVFGFLIGSWDIDAVLHDGAGRTQRARGEVHASWVLEGRAIQDLFIFPRPADRASGVRGPADRYATTIRTYDRKRSAWRVVFINPAAAETNAELLARREGDAVAMEGNLADGTPIRWRYEDVMERSFHYSARRLRQDDRSWQLYLEIFGKRIGEKRE
jgi:hypothetical protein